jgi:chemotaxis signal transduction protein
MNVSFIPEIILWILSTAVAKTATLIIGVTHIRKNPDY